MTPAASVSGLYFAHPDARYFAIGPIQRDQVDGVRAGEARCRCAEMERWLGPSLGYEPRRSASRGVANARTRKDARSTLRTNFQALRSAHMDARSSADGARLSWTARMTAARARLVLLVPGREAISLDLQRLVTQAVLVFVVAPLLLGIGARQVFDGLLGRTPFGFVLVPSDASGSLYGTRPVLRTYDEAPATVAVASIAPQMARGAEKLLTVSAAAVARAFGAERAPIAEATPDLQQGPLRLVASHLGESLRVVPFGADGAADPQAFAALAHLMRCRVTGEEAAVDPALVRILLALGNSYRRPLMLISGHRAAHVNGTSETSQHTSGRAADVRVWSGHRRAAQAGVRARRARRGALSREGLRAHRRAAQAQVLVDLHGGAGRAGLREPGPGAPRSGGGDRDRAPSPSTSTSRVADSETAPAADSSDSASDSVPVPVPMPLPDSAPAPAP